MTQEHTQLVTDFKGTFGTEEGERVLKYLERRCGFKDDNMPAGNDGHVDMMQLASKVGMRSVYNEIMRLVDANLSEEQQTETINEE